MNRFRMLCALALGLLLQPAWAAPIGWYELEATWRDGAFRGGFYYDSGSPARVTAARGTLASLAQTTAVSQVYYLDQDEPAPWHFFANSNPAAPGGHDAGFYLTLSDLGGALTLDLAGLNALYDWSDAALYHPDRLDASPLLSFTLTPSHAVAEPGSVVLLLAGVAALVLRRRGGRRE